MIGAGTIIKCRNGHEICEVAIGLKAYDVIKTSCFSNYRNSQRIPRAGELMQDCLCSICSAKWMYDFFMDNRGKFD